MIIANIIAHAYSSADYLEVSFTELQSRRQAVEGVYTQAVGEIFEGKGMARPTNNVLDRLCDLGLQVSQVRQL